MVGLAIRESIIIVAAIRHLRHLQPDAGPPWSLVARIWAIAPSGALVGDREKADYSPCPA